MEQPVNTLEAPISEYYRENLKRVFDHYFLEVFRDRKESNLKIMSVGCGLGFEADPLLKTFPNATYTGIDIDPEAIDGAKLINKDLDGNCDFKTADAGNIDAFEERKWDIVMVRHSQVLGSTRDLNLEKDWALILENCIVALKTGGILFVSMDMDEERKQIREYLNKHNAKIKIAIDEKNIFPSRKGTHKDSFVIVAKRN